MVSPWDEGSPGVRSLREPFSPSAGPLRLLSTQSLATSPLCAPPTAVPATTAMSSDRILNAAAATPEAPWVSRGSETEAPEVESVETREAAQAGDVTRMGDEPS